MSDRSIQAAALYTDSAIERKPPPIAAQNKTAGKAGRAVKFIEQSLARVARRPAQVHAPAPGGLPQAHQPASSGLGFGSAPRCAGAVFQVRDTRHQRLPAEKTG